MHYSDENQLSELADQLVMIRNDSKQSPLDCEKWAGFQPTTISQAYQIQNLVAHSFKPVAAWKAYKLPGVQQVVGAPIFQTDCYQSNSFGALRSFRDIAIEAELGYRISEDVDAEYRAYTASDMLELVDAIVPLIEIVDSRLLNFQSAGSFWQLADNSVNGGLVLGNAVLDWQSIDPNAQRVDLYVDDELLAQGDGWQQAYSPLELIAEFANGLSDHCGGLKKGQIIATGSLTGFNVLPQGAAVKAQFRDCDRDVLAQF